MSVFCSRMFVVSLLWLLASATAQNCTSIYFSYITTITGGFQGDGAIPIVDLALEEINKRTDILPNYTLGYSTIRDSKVIS